MLASRLSWTVGVSNDNHRVQANTTLIRLDLGFNDLGRPGAEALGTALQANTTLLSLSLRGCKIGGKGGLAIAAALQVPLHPPPSPCFALHFRVVVV